MDFAHLHSYVGRNFVLTPRFCPFKFFSFFIICIANSRFTIIYNSTYTKCPCNITIIILLRWPEFRSYALACDSVNVNSGQFVR
ncbi:hypothetical protein RIR_e22413_A0A2N1M8I5_9GLOM [Rhizophagus irregularis DAOM 181602=DAOM 197198]|uniref:Uncharacterized protein n=1 Tax=Rhizophagus irregularis TaxID=588596 RepID=A0A2N1M8I5_9GLOM|nr:hypothetical protein RhiirC2_824322 [Rhizophagus irregularis]GET56751.1 hypothetical protein RIR_e22413_A0A2N1M8I5_9GLOM [Rhizophagus irregularis DAOM 181602=DAOM 197198]